MARLLAKMMCLTIAAAAGLAVIAEVATIKEGWIPWAAGGTSLVIVFVVLYFPLLRPIADAIGDKLAASMHRGRHVRTGSGLDEVPDAPKSPACSICGDPRGPICPECNRKMAESNSRKPDINF